MNLLEMMKQEVSDLKLVDKLEIAYYLYMRTGQIFDYVPFVPFLSWEEKEVYKTHRVDAQNIQNKYLICYSWAYLYKDLLESFGIFCNVVEQNLHAYVTFIHDGESYVADLMSKYEDLCRIKVGLPVLNFGKKFNNSLISYSGNFDTAYGHFLEKTKSTLLASRNAMAEKWDKIVAKHEYEFLVFKSIEKIMNEKHKDVEFLVGEKYISSLLKEFIYQGFTPSKAYFHDLNFENFIVVYSLTRGNEKPCYFSYEKCENGFYELHEVPLIYVQSLLGSYVAHRVEYLELPREETIYDLTRRKINLASVK